MMIRAVEHGAIFLHSIKHGEVLEQLLIAHEDYVRRGSPTPKTMTLAQYVQDRGGNGDNFTFEVERPGMWEGETIRI